MPSRNIVKTYTENGYYHIYNRGVEKRTIFLDEHDCRVFLLYLKLYLSPIEELKNQNITGIRMYRFLPQNLSTEADLLCYALMPNHFHLLVKQYTNSGITKLMRRLTTSYVMYFNRKYKRVGGLFQNSFKAAFIDKDEYLLQCSRYIHLNPTKITSNIDFLELSSYPNYLGKKHASWVKPKEILDYFKNPEKQHANNSFSYQDFFEDLNGNTEEILGDLTLEDDD